MPKVWSIMSEKAGLHWAELLPEFGSLQAGSLERLSGPDQPCPHVHEWFLNCGFSFAFGPFAITQTPFQITENGSYRKVRPGWRHSQTLSAVLTRGRENSRLSASDNRVSAVFFFVYMRGLALVLTLLTELTHKRTASLSLYRGTEASLGQWFHVCYLPADKSQNVCCKKGSILLGHF